MAGIFAITTPDPAFDPDKPVKVNGFCFLPARRVLAKVGGRSGIPLEPMGGRHVTSSAERATIDKTEDRGGSAPVKPGEE